MPIQINGTSGISGVDGSAGTPALQGTDSNTGIAFGSDVIIGSTGGTERWRTDASGRVLVGTTTQYSGITGQLLSTAAAGSLTYAGLGITTFSSSTGNQAGSLITLDKSNSNTLGTNTAVLNGDQLGIIAFRGADGGSNFRDAAYIQCVVDGTVSGGGAADMPGRLVFYTTKDNQASPTEALRINSLQQVCVNRTSSLGGGFVNILGGSSTTIGLVIQSIVDNNWGAGFYNAAGSNVGNITIGASATAYNTTSDYRLKENIILIADGIERLKYLRPSRFNFIADPDTTVDGFIAHEVAEIVPEAISGTKDAVNEDGSIRPQGIDQSKLVPLLTAALQEAIGEIESLKARLTAAGI